MYVYKIHPGCVISEMMKRKHFIINSHIRKRIQSNKMSRIHIKQIGNNQAAAGATIIFDNNSNNWSNNLATSLRLPAGNTASRPVSAFAGMIRFNTDNNQFEGYDGTAWNAFSFGSAIKQTFTNADLVSNIYQWNHNLNLNEPGIIQVFDNNDIQVFPDSITFVNNNTVEINLSSFSPITGTWVVVLVP